MIDIGALMVEIDVQSGELLRVLGNWTGLEDPGVPIPPNITALTGITQAMVAGHRFDEDGLRAHLSGCALVIAHNASFDRPFFEARFPWFERIPWACSQRLVDWQREGFGSSKLEFIAYRLGYFFDGHRALVDCHALARILFESRLASTGESALCRILDAFEAPDYVVYANAAPFEAKDVLKAHGYRWDAEGKVWSKALIEPDEQALQDELDWLRINVYTHRPARVQVEHRDALVKYTGRSGYTELRSIGPQGDSGRAFTSAGRRGF